MVLHIPLSEMYNMRDIDIVHLYYRDFIISVASFGKWILCLLDLVTFIADTWMI